MADITGTSGDDTLIGTADADIISGVGGNDTLNGEGGNDLLNGGTGIDRLVGGIGDDRYIVDDAADIVVEAAGQGYDIVYTTVSYVLDQGNSVEVLSALDSTTTNAMNLTGNNLDNWVHGNNGANILVGGYLGGSGIDRLVGFAGDDRYIVDDAADIVIEAAGQGYDIVYTTVSYVLDPGNSIEVLSALDPTTTNAMNLTGNNLDNWVHGNNGANILSGGYLGQSGIDRLVGFAGDDLYIVDDAADIVIEAAGQGYDIVYTTVSYVLAQGNSVEVLSALDPTTTNAMNLTGNELDNWVHGNNGANILSGGYLGQSGIDRLVGFAGDDLYIVDDAADIVIEAAGQGYDIVYTTVSYVLAPGNSVEVLSALDSTTTNAMNLTGNELDNGVHGNNGANILSGGYLGQSGIDQLVGFAGDDRYIVDDAADIVVEAAGQGYDIVYTTVSYVLAQGNSVEVLSALDSTTTNAMNLTGNNLANGVHGNNGANVLDGGGGADQLVGFGGTDAFAFTTALGAGNVDTIVDFQVGVDKIVLAGVQGDPFASLATGALAAGSFRSGTADPYAGASLPSPGTSQIGAMDANDYILYNTSSGALLYDADGNGAGAAVQFATLQPGLSLTAADFIVSGPANNAPTVTSGASASIAENSPASTIVYQATASDADGDRITWSLSGTDASLLTIDAVTGAVRLITSADFETKVTYSFNVVASDSATSTPRAVSLTITDVADLSTPIINETAAANDAVGTAQAIDRGIFTVAPNGNLFNPSLPSATIQGIVSAPGDTDFFSITLQAGELLVLDVDIDPANGLDSFLTLFGPGGVLIGDNDDLISHDPGSGTQFGHNTDSQIRFRAAVSGTYYFSVASFSDEQGPTSSGAYSLNVSIGPPATPQQLIQEDIEALVSGESWNHLNLTYGFPTLASQYPSNPSEVQNGFTPFTAGQQGATSLIVQLIANVTPLTFQQLTANPGAADLRYAMSNEPDVAYAYYPTNGGPSSLGGTAWFNHTNFNSPQQGNYAWMGILHETGHALGLKHGHEFPVALSADRDSVEYSVMTYRSYPGQDLSGGGGYTNETTSYPQTLMMYDIAALQQIYGANFSFNSGDSVYTWNPTTGQMRINGGIATSPAGNHVFLTVWDGGGNDTYDLSNYTASDTMGSTTIDLRPGEWSTISQVQIASLGGSPSHFARGNVANALLYQGNTASLIENASGSQTADTIIANQVANHLTGNGGADTFKWTASTDSTAGAQADTIMDFLSGTDHIDLSVIDANPATGANDQFTFIGTSAFHNVAGELRYDVTGGNAHIFADLDGNGVADMEIIVNNVTTLAGTDFFV